jgi:putative acyl-CoA dehydrogenase
MVFTEKQGGSDLRANSTVAEPIGDGWFELTGHKWFCTHPVFEVFFTLAQTDAGITCFVASGRIRASGSSAEGQARRPLSGLLGGRVRPPARAHPRRGGRGTAFVVEQLIWTRLDTLTPSPA